MTRTGESTRLVALLMGSSFHGMMSCLVVDLLTLWSSTIGAFSKAPHAIWSFLSMVLHCTADVQLTGAE